MPTITRLAAVTALAAFVAYFSTTTLQSVAAMLPF